MVALASERGETCRVGHVQRQKKETLIKNRVETKTGKVRIKNKREPESTIAKREGECATVQFEIKASRQSSDGTLAQSTGGHTALSVDNGLRERFKGPINAL